MPNRKQSALIEENELALNSHGIWSDGSVKEFGYSDGNSAEDTLRKIVVKAKDQSSTSLELETASFDWISNYHLSSERSNIYKFLNLTGIKLGLELGAGCGAITRYLGENGINVDAVEGSAKRAEICRLRCQDLTNISVIQSNFNNLKLPADTYDAVFLNGVLEYASRFLDDSADDQTALRGVLKKSLQSLNSNGVACVAIENRMGLKYWLGAKEDHFGFPYIGLYDYPNKEGIRTYDKDEWESILSSLPGTYSYKFIYPFPDYKMAKAILTDTFIKENSYAYSHLYRIASTEDGVALQSQINEFLLWQSLHAKGKLEHYANSFFILISKDEQRLSSICSYDFMHFSGKGRKPEYRTITSKKCNSHLVTKEYVHKSPKENNHLNHDLSDDEYANGPLLVTNWLKALAGGDIPVFERCVGEYYRYIRSYFEKHKEVKDAFDILPFNIISTDNENWLAIDREWVVDVELTPEYLLFRALFWFPAGNESLLRPIFIENDLSTLHDFISYYFKKLSLDLNEGLDTFVANEELLQSQIAYQLRENPIQNMLAQPIRQSDISDLSTSYMTQLYWAGSEADWSEDRSVFEPGKLGSELQEFSFTLPQADDEIAKLRFDPADRAGFFRIERIKILPIEKDENSEGWELNGNNAIAQVAELCNVEYCKNSLGDLFISTGNDPHFIFNLSAEVQNWLQTSGILFRVSMDWPKSADYIVVMDSLGKKVVEQQGELQRLSLIEKQSQTQAERISEQAAKLKETSDQVRSKDIYIEAIEKEIEAMRQTRVWRLAEYLRMKVYYRLLDAKTLFQKSIKTLRQEGVAQFIRKAKQQLSSSPDSAKVGLNRTDYNLWVEHTKLTEYDIQEIRNNIKEFDVSPKFSIIVPVYNVDQEWLERTIDSVRNQLYENWELCLADDLSPSPHIKIVLQQYADLDSRIKVLFKEKNEGIAITSNAALSIATGDYVALLDHDDELTIDALYENARLINRDPSAGLIYSDEDKLDMQGRRCDPFFKPDYSPELIHSQNYICHFTVIKKSIVDDLGGFREGFDGSQDHDLILRAIEKSAKVYHIPKVLYHWRKIPGSTAAVYDSKSYAWEAGRKAVEDSLKRSGTKGSVAFARFQGSYRASNNIEGSPLISIIIPFKDKPELLKTAINSIIEKSTYENFEILGINNNSEGKETHQLMEALGSKDKRIKFVEYNIPFNYSDINNHAATLAQGDYLLLLNNDVEIISPGWLEALLEFAQMPDIGAVGGRLYYPDNRIQHAGLVIGMAGVAGPPHYLFHKDDVGYYARSHVIHNVSAVTGACLMVKKKLWQAVEGMDAENFGVAYNDVDFCLKLQKKGYRNVFTPYCEMYHYESQSRGYEDTPEKQERLARESNAFREKWNEYFENGDPYHNPNLSLEKTNYSINI